MVCVLNGSSGSQCRGVLSQANDTWRAFNGTRLLDMASMY